MSQKNIKSMTFPKAFIVVESKKVPGKPTTKGI